MINNSQNKIIYRVYQALHIISQKQIELANIASTEHFENDSSENKSVWQDHIRDISICMNELVKAITTNNIQKSKVRARDRENDLFTKLTQLEEAAPAVIAQCNQVWQQSEVGHISMFCQARLKDNLRRPINTLLQIVAPASCDIGDVSKQVIEYLVTLGQLSTTKPQIIKTQAISAAWKFDHAFRTEASQYWEMTDEVWRNRFVYQKTNYLPCNIIFQGTGVDERLRKGYQTLRLCHTDNVDNLRHTENMSTHQLWYQATINHYTLEDNHILEHHSPNDQKYAEFAMFFFMLDAYWNLAVLRIQRPLYRGAQMSISQTQINQILLDYINKQKVRSIDVFMTNMQNQGEIKSEFANRLKVNEEEARKFVDDIKKYVIGPITRLSKLYTLSSDHAYLDSMQSEAIRSIETQIATTTRNKSNSQRQYPHNRLDYVLPQLSISIKSLALNHNKGMLGPRTEAELGKLLFACWEALTAGVGYGGQRKNKYITPEILRYADITVEDMFFCFQVAKQSRSLGQAITVPFAILENQFAQDKKFNDMVTLNRQEHDFSHFSTIERLSDRIYAVRDEASDPEKIEGKELAELGVVVKQITKILKTNQAHDGHKKVQARGQSYSRNEKFKLRNISYKFNLSKLRYECKLEFNAQKNTHSQANFMSLAQELSRSYNKYYLPFILLRLPRKALFWFSLVTSLVCWAFCGYFALSGDIIGSVVQGAIACYLNMDFMKQYLQTRKESLEAMDNILKKYADHIIDYEDTKKIYTKGESEVFQKWIKPWIGNNIWKSASCFTVALAFFGVGGTVGVKAITQYIRAAWSLLIQSKLGAHSVVGLSSMCLRHRSLPVHTNNGKHILNVTPTEKALHLPNNF